jgi:hypothetical protein
VKPAPSYPVLIPYVTGMLRDETVRSVTREARTVGWHVALTNIDPAADTGYWMVLRDWWAAGCGFVVVEQDVEVPEGAFAGFASCPQPWCAHPYDCGSMVNVLALGCTKFASWLCREHPDAVDVAGNLADDGLPVGSWRRMDTRLMRVLREAEMVCHAHHPPAVHHHAYPWKVEVS